MTADEQVAEESRRKDRELDLREREVMLKEKEANASKWSNPLVIALFAATVGLVGNIVVARVNNQNTQAIERLHAQSSLILEAIKTDKKSACDNLIFFINLGFIDDHGNTIRNVCPETKNQVPSLPVASQSPVESNLFLIHVTDEKQQPISRARVLLDTAKEEGTCVTSDSGECFFRTKIPDVTAKATITKEGFSPVTQYILAGAVTNIVLRKQ
jgi:hypothetical protein